MKTNEGLVAYILFGASMFCCFFVVTLFRPADLHTASTVFPIFTSVPQILKFSFGAAIVMMFIQSPVFATWITLCSIQSNKEQLFSE